MTVWIERYGLIRTKFRRLTYSLRGLIGNLDQKSGKEKDCGMTKNRLYFVRQPL